MVELDNQLNIKNVKIADFGSAKLFVKDANEQHTEKVGTPMYAAPEVMTEWGDGKYGPAIDIYSAGVAMLRVGLGSDYDEALEKEAEVYGCIGVFPTTFFSSDHVVRNQTISSFLGKFPDATIVKEMVGLAPEDRPSAEVILTNKWLRNTTLNLIRDHRAEITSLEELLPKEADAETVVSATEEEIQEAQGRVIKLAKDLESVQAEKEDALQQNKEKDAEINRLCSELKALQAKTEHDARDGSGKDFEGAGPDDNATSSTTGNEVSTVLFLIICNMCYFSSISMSPSLSP